MWDSRGRSIAGLSQGALGPSGRKRTLHSRPFVSQSLGARDPHRHPSSFLLLSTIYKAFLRIQNPSIPTFPLFTAINNYPLLLTYIRDHYCQSYSIRHSRGEARDCSLPETRVRGWLRSSYTDHPKIMSFACTNGTVLKSFLHRFLLRHGSPSDQIVSPSASAATDGQPAAVTQVESQTARSQAIAEHNAFSPSVTHIVYSTPEELKGDVAGLPRFSLNLNEEEGPPEFGLRFGRFLAEATNLEDEKLFVTWALKSMRDFMNAWHVRERT